MNRTNRTRLFLIRHGDTIDEETKKVFKGTSDIPLSEKGRTKLQKASQFLTRYNFDHIYTSALSRCIESGKIIAEPHNLDTEIAEAFNEIHFGIWEGRSFEEIDEENPTEFRRWVKNPDIHTPPQGEPLIDAQQRSVAIFHEMINRHRGQNTVIVTHAGILRLILASILDMKISAIFRIGQDYGCINIIDIYKDDIAVIKLLNFTMY
ncbi:MAG: histidine phosphatase family protein [Proteobacteria bacterium]|nr:histidine phosphatase family protein [Pseudomonadota bacterium]